ncbi:hypothetical protein ACFPL7_05035 [Dongia soli]|uniref:Response regulatory domain-containing protein n=1 Tax=Dongia soli TaxID=600628 RepID=A0ABU5EH66_9PROT|nr:hypothetical protein [Dongia soli]MDY0884763.1 hypothetical protein [Dongia soli]
MPNSNRLPLDGERLLIIEDEVLIALDMEATLLDAGAENVELLTTRREAMANLDGQGYTAAVLDIRVGNGTTYEIALRLNDDNIPFIFCSGQDLSADMRAKLPDAILLRKPVMPSDLIQGILQAIKQRA